MKKKIIKKEKDLIDLMLRIEILEDEFLIIKEQLEILIERAYPKPWE